MAEKMKLHKKSPLYIQLSDKIYNELTYVMNEVHNLDYSERFWSMVLEHYVWDVISKKEILEERACNELPAFFPNTVYAVSSKVFPGRKEKVKRFMIMTVKHFKSWRDWKKSEKKMSFNNDINIGFPGDISQRNIELGAAISDYFPLIKYPLIKSWGARKKREKLLQVSNAYTDLYLKNIVKNIPKLYVEYFDNLIKNIKVYSPSDKTFHIHMIGSIFSRVLVAKYREHGAKIIWYQHGSHYGEFESEYSYHMNHKHSDEFRTWGWKIKKKDVPWKAYRLDKFRIDYESFRKSNYTYDLMICFPKQSYINEHDYNTLIQQLNYPKFNKILARPRPVHLKWSQASQLDFINDKRVEVSSGLTLVAEDVSKCKLVLQLNIPGTNFLECIYVDHPVIGTLKNDQPTEIIEPYYKFFKQSGVLHENVHSMADHLNSITIGKWWKEIIESRTYQSFKDKFTRKV